MTTRSQGGGKSHFLIVIYFLKLYVFKHIAGCADNYVERLKRLKLQSLELRRLHLDLIWCYKIVFECVNVNMSESF